MTEPVDAPAAPGLRSSLRDRGPRYLGVTVGNLVFGQVLLLGVQYLLPDNRRALANAIAVAICAVPTYWLHRRWVWEKRGRSAFRTEIAPFWLFAGLGLVASTAMVAVSQTLWRNAFDAPLPAIITNLVSIGTFTVIWIARFFWMDKAFGIEREP